MIDQPQILLTLSPSFPENLNLAGPTNGDVLLISNNTAGGLKPSGTQQSKWEGLAMLSATSILADAEETYSTIDNVITGAASVSYGRKCTYQFDPTIAAGNKGIEEIFVWDAANGTRYMMGICEGPGCAASTLTSSTSVWPPNNAAAGKIMVFYQVRERIIHPDASTITLFTLAPLQSSRKLTARGSTT